MDTNKNNVLQKKYFGRYMHISVIYAPVADIF